MDEILLNKLTILKNHLNNDRRILLLDKLDNELKKSDEVIAFSYAKDMACLKYEDALKHYGENSNEALLAQKELFNAKMKLDNLDLTKRYNEAYLEVKKLYENINMTLFMPFKGIEND